MQISEAWVRAHGLTLPSDMLPNENMIGQMWRELHVSRRQRSIYLMETLRVQSSIAPKNKAFVIASKPVEPSTTEDFVADEIGTSMEAYSRARTFP